MGEEFNEAVTLYQEAEAISCAITLLDRWRDLGVLTDALREARREIVSKAEKIEIRTV